MAAGRPRKIKSVRQFDRLAQAYFDECERNNEPVLLTGLILALGLSSRESLDEYGRRKEFSDSVKRAKLRVEMEYEKTLKGAYPTGAIFALKNFGWTDKQDVELSGPHDGPIMLEHKHDLSMLSMSELMTLEAIVSKVEGCKNGIAEQERNPGLD